MTTSTSRRARRTHIHSPRPRWLLIADRSRPRIEVAAGETIDGAITFRTVEATGATRVEALSELSHLVSQAGGVPAWETPLPSGNQRDFSMTASGDQPTGEAPMAASGDRREGANSA
jgi:hypothetical protein